MFRQRGRRRIQQAGQTVEEKFFLIGQRGRRIMSDGGELLQVDRASVLKELFRDIQGKGRDLRSAVNLIHRLGGIVLRRAPTLFDGGCPFALPLAHQLLRFGYLLWCHFALRTVQKFLRPLRTRRR